MQGIATPSWDFPVFKPVKRKFKVRINTNWLPVVDPQLHTQHGGLVKVEDSEHEVIVKNVAMMTIDATGALLFKDDMGSLVIRGFAPGVWRDFEEIK